MDEELQFSLLSVDTEEVRWRRRAMFLMSVLLHAVVIIFMLVEPDLFRRGAHLFGIEVRPAQNPETTFLYLPPQPPKRAKPPATPLLSDQDRRAQGAAPKIDPNGLRMPYSLGNTKLPEVAGGAQPSPPKAAPPPSPAGAPQAASAAPPPPKTNDNGLKLEDVPARPTGDVARLRVPPMTAGEAIRQSLEEASRGRPSEATPGPGDSPAEFDNQNPNFSVQGPMILSDTKGVDFGPYLARVVYTVRHNWYAVIPESVRLGEKGRVALVFEIVKDGSVPQLRLVSSSGSAPLDRAAIASINASNPFPPLPPEFTGNHLVLEFVYLYNMGYGP